MRVLTKEEIQQQRLKIVRQLRDCLFIHPTDTIYGIGCNATDSKLVRKLRTVKKQYNRPLSIIPPSKQWILDNCQVSNEADEWLERLPGPYTFILKLSNKDAVARNINLGVDTIGIRIPRHWISELVKDIGVPIVTTSANIAGKDFMTSRDDIDKSIEKEMEYLLYDGEMQGKPSQIVDLSKEEPVILRN